MYENMAIQIQQYFYVLPVKTQVLLLSEPQYFN